MAETVFFWLLGPSAGFILGILHTIMPCEDKAIFCFYAFGVSRDWKQSFRILTFYGAGLFLTNFIIGTILSIIADNLQNLLPLIDERTFHIISAFSLILGGIIMLYRISHNQYFPHSDQIQELGENITQLRVKKRTSFLLGILAGIPPCIFELTVYSQSMIFAAQSSWGNGAWTMLFFGLGTWLGLIPLVLVGSMSGKIAQLLRQSSLKRLQKKMQIKKEKKNPMEFQQENSNKNFLNLKTNNKDSLYTKIEFFSAILLIVIGIFFSILALFGIELFSIPAIEPPITIPPEEIIKQQILFFY